ncbi:MAG: hypothetical protein E7544_06330 [Ruminococcaceae bacterium]|nr:hypothetical protein [Oscillospiraceae bacterium]
MKEMLRKLSKFLSFILFTVTAIAFTYSLYLILYYFDIIPNRNLGFLDISHLISGIVAVIGTVTGLLGFLLYRLSRKKDK